MTEFLCFYQSPVLLLFIISCPEEQQHWRTLGGVIHWWSPLEMELLAGGGGNIWATRPNWFLWTGISESGAERELQSPASPGNDPNLIIFFVSGRGLKLKEIVGEQSTATYWDLDWTFNNCRHSTWDLALVSEASSLIIADDKCHWYYWCWWCCGAKRNGGRVLW